MNSMIHEVNAAMATQPESSKSGSTHIGKDFKITLDELLKDLGTKNEISPLLGLLLAFNPMLPLNDKGVFQGAVTNIDNNMNQGNVPTDTANSNAVQLLKFILASDTLAMPATNAVPSDVQEMWDKNISLPVENIMPLLNNSMASDDYKVASENTGDSAKTLLDNVIKIKAEGTKADNQTQTEHVSDEPIPVKFEDDMQKAQADKFKDMNKINTAEVTKQEDKAIGDFKTVDMLKQVSSEKHDLNIINTSFNIPDVKVSDDKVSKTVTVPSKVQIGDIIKQIAEGTKISVTDKSRSEAIINLKPPNLGKLLMEVMVDKNVVTAKITAQNSDVKNIIEANINQLKDSLSQQGMHVDSLMVSVDSSGLFDGGHQQGHERHQRYFFTDNDKPYEDYDFYSYVDKDHVDCIV